MANNDEDLATAIELNAEENAEQQQLQQLVNAASVRFEQKRRIYTKIGTRDLLALNPSERLPIYDGSVMAQYAIGQNNNQQQQSQQAAHIFSIAAQALKETVGNDVPNGKQQSEAAAAILFCGEAGSGKTDNLFHALRYFTFVEQQQRVAKEKTVKSSSLKIDPELADAIQRVLAAFGSAKTLKNDCSTRHGYSVDLHYLGDSLVGISIDPIVPLELSRLVQQRKGERNFGCFYQLCSGIGPEEREKLGLKMAGNYFYLNQGKCPGLDVKKETEQFIQLCRALSRIGFSDHQQELILRLLAAILHIGNLFFRARKPSKNDEEEDDDQECEEFAELANESELRWVAGLLDVDIGQLKRILMLGSDGTRLSVDGALDRRDWFAKCIYNQLFRWILARISSFLRCCPNNDEQQQEQKKMSKISLVDMPGYERYNNNDFEEFCVNLVSERLERFFQQQRFGQFHDDELRDARPELGHHQWPNNERVLAMLFDRPTGILPLLEDECKFPRGSDETFLQHCNINHLDKSIYRKARLKGRLEMGIRQHFGLAFYAIDGFLHRNRFFQPAAFFQLLGRSKDTALAAIFSSGNEDKWVYVAAEWQKGVQRMCGQLTGANIHFVRCVRTNLERIAGKWDANAVARQFKALNLPEHCRAVRLAFPHKLTIDDFVDQFKALLPDEVVRGQSAQRVAKDVLMAQGVRFERHFVLGPLHVFLRDSLFVQLKEMLAYTKKFAAIVIQRNLRKFLAQRAYILKRAAIISLQAGYRGWKCRKQLSERRERQSWMNKYGLKEGNKNVKESLGRIRKCNNMENGVKKHIQMSLECVRDLPAELRQTIESIFANGDDCPNDNAISEFKQHSKYISAPKSKSLKEPPMVDGVSLEQFAADNFKTILLGCRREPIETPFLPKETEREFEQSLELFKLVLLYQFEPDGTDPRQLAKLAEYIVQQGIDHLPLRDELFAQLLNQTHNCLCDGATHRIWTLMLAAVHAFPPSGHVFPVLYSCFQAQRVALSQMLIGGLLMVSALPELAATNRTLAPTLMEQTAFERRQPLMFTVQFADGETLNVEANSWTTSEELVQLALRQRGIGDEFGWGLHIDDGKMCTELAASLFPFDAIAQLEQNGQPILKNCSGANNESPFALFDSPGVKQQQQNQNVSGTTKTANGHGTEENNSKALDYNGTDRKNGIENHPRIERQSFNQTIPMDYQRNRTAFSEFYRPSYLKTPPTGSIENGGQNQQRYGQYGGNGFSSTQFAPPPMVSVPPAQPQQLVRHRFDATGLQWRRQAANTNCMSRITEKDETESMVSTLHRGQAPNIGPNNTIGRIRNMPIPGDDQNVDHFLDNVFEQALPPTDYDNENNEDEQQNGNQQKDNNINLFDKAIVGRLAASIKGGDFYQPEMVAVQRQPMPQMAGYGQQAASRGWQPSGPKQNPLFNGQRQQQPQQWPPKHQQQPQQPQQHRFIYRPGGDILLDNGNGQVLTKSPPPANNQQHQQQQPPYESIGFQQQNVANSKFASSLPSPPRYQPNGEFAAPTGEQSRYTGAPIVNVGGGGGLRRFNVSNNNFQPVADNESRYHEISAREHQQQQQFQRQNAEQQHQEMMSEDTATLRSVEDGSSVQQQLMCSQDTRREELDSQTLTAGNEWVPESEATLDALFSTSTQNGHGHIPVGNGQTNIYATSGRPKSNSGSELGDTLIGPKGKETKKKPAALAYVKQPFHLIVRKQIFLPEELLDDALEIDLIFAQIIRDCRQRTQLRIRKYERESVNQLLRSYNVSPAALNTPAQIATNIKLEVISIVRKWPLYFCRLFPCIEERPNGDRVPLLLGVGESGVRLIAVTFGGNRNQQQMVNNTTDEQQQQQQLTIQDHFEFTDIADLLLERAGHALRLITRQHIAILLAGPNLAQARHCIQQFLGIGAKRRQFVIAVADYSTNEENVLSFETGVYIQLLDKPDSEAPRSAATWLYGRLDGRFGWLPAEYVLDANSQEDQSILPPKLYSASCNGISMSESGAVSFSAFGANSFTTANGPNAIPLVLEPLFANIDPATLFLPDNIGVEHFTMVEFAIRFFRRPKGSANAEKKHKDFYASGNWSWKEVTDQVKFTDRLIGHSLLRLESHEADKVAQQTFLCIMRFMGDEALKRNQSFTDCVYELLSLCHQYVLIRDEVYCQLLKQITANRSEKCNESALRGWRLLSILCAYFQCSETLKPYLLKFVGDVCFDQRRTFNALGKLCLFNLAQTYRYGGRRLILGAAEVEAIANGRSVRRQWYNLPGGHRRQICTRSVTVAEEIVQALCMEMNIRGQAEQQEFTLCYLLEKDNSVCTLLNDEYVMDVVTDLEQRGEEYLLILMRSVWLHPLRRDSELYTDALFFQLMPNYLAGLYSTLRLDGTATAAILNEVATLGALLLLSDPYQQNINIEGISPTNLTNFVPKTILQFAGITADQWAQRIQAKIDELEGGEYDEFGASPIRARQRFLEIVERWPLFGAAFYAVQRVFNGKANSEGMDPNINLIDQNCIVAINKFGVRILTNEMHQTLAEIALEEIREMAKYSVAETNYIELRLSAASANKFGVNELTVETDLGNEISRLVGHYIFLSGSPRK